MNNPVTLLVVKSLKTSKAFYIDVLGMALIEEYDDCIKLQFGNHDIIIFQGINKSIEYQHGYDANSTLVFPTENLDEKISALKALGVEFVHDTPNENRWGRYAGFKDPSGIVFEFMEFHQQE
jgi:predicted enzyme related to lactoylglutathione lyase